jgi:hypothetical protein
MSRKLPASPSVAVAADAQTLTSVTVAANRTRSRQRADSYLVAADAPATIRAYVTDWKHFSLWCAARALKPMPPQP